MTGRPRCYAAITLHWGSAMKSTEDKRYCQFNPGHFPVWAELTDIRTRPVSVTHFIALSDGLLEGEYRLVRAPVDNKSTSVKLFIIEQRSAWGTITPMKQKDDEQLLSEEQRKSPDIHFGNPNHADKQVSEQRRSPELTFGSRMSRSDFEDVERRMKEQQALVADIKSKRQTDDDKTG